MTPCCHLPANPLFTNVRLYVPRPSITIISRGVTERWLKELYLYRHYINSPPPPFPLHPSSASLQHEIYKIMKDRWLAEYTRSPSITYTNLHATPHSSTSLAACKTHRGACTKNAQTPVAGNWHTNDRSFEMELQAEKRGNKSVWFWGTWGGSKSSRK